MLKIDRSVSRIEEFEGSASKAKGHLRLFIKNKLDRYADLRNDPSEDFQSNMSPYLHFGQISPLYIALEVLRTDSLGKEAYLEELIVRRELTVNFISYNNEYDPFNCLPHWASKTLMGHKKDMRPYNYELEDLEKVKTHDPIWNSA